MLVDEWDLEVVVPAVIVAQQKQLQNHKSSHLSVPCPPPGYLAVHVHWCRLPHAAPR